MTVTGTKFIAPFLTCVMLSASSLCACMTSRCEFIFLRPLPNAARTTLCHGACGQQSQSTPAPGAPTRCTSCQLNITADRADMAKHLLAQQHLGTLVDLTAVVDTPILLPVRGRTSEHSPAPPILTDLFHTFCLLTV
jgi:hypothetical protein